MKKDKRFEKPNKGQKDVSCTLGWTQIVQLEGSEQLQPVFAQ